VALNADSMASRMIEDLLWRRGLRKGSLPWNPPLRRPCDRVSVGLCCIAKSEPARDVGNRLFDRSFLPSCMPQMHRQIPCSSRPSRMRASDDESYDNRCNESTSQGLNCGLKPLVKDSEDMEKIEHT
jgi:hypothetical protein